MPETVLEQLKKQLDLESQSPEVVRLPGDFYSKVCSYSQTLRRSGGSNSSEAAQRLIEVQLGLIESMSAQLIEERTKKARARGAFSRLLPEERYVCSPSEKFEKRYAALVQALSGGQPAFVEFARRAETKRAVTVRFTRRVEERVGFDMKRYGPFEAEDVASIPADSAEVLVSGGAAVEVYPRESD